MFEAFLALALNTLGISPVWRDGGENVKWTVMLKCEISPNQKFLRDGGGCGFLGNVK